MRHSIKKQLPYMVSKHLSSLNAGMGVGIFVIGLWLLSPVTSSAQDDMYFTPTKENTAQERKTREAEKKEKSRLYKDSSYYSGIDKTDDEYNRRTKKSGNVPYTVDESQLSSGDSLASDVIRFNVGDGSYTSASRVDTVYRYVVLDDEDYRMSRNLSRFYDFCWWMDFYCPSFFYGRSLAWYTGWYDPWCSPWYDPWYYNWYSPWYDPWYASVVFGLPYWYYRPYYPPVWTIVPPGHHGGHGGSHLPFKGHSTHSFRDMASVRHNNNNHRIAERNGDVVTRNTGIGGSRNYSGRGGHSVSGNGANPNRSSWSTPSQSGSSSRSRGGHTISGGTRSVGGHTGGSFGGGRSGGGHTGGSFGGGRHR